MVEHEVEETLREIRERVLAESASAVAEPLPTLSAREAATHAADGAAQVAHADARAGEALSRLGANLSTTERAWSRLPPLMSNRSGATARLELWLKRQIKRATHWFTWEQVNFNSAVHHALNDARETLAAHERALAQVSADNASLRASLRDMLERMRSDSEDGLVRASEVRAQIANVESRLAADLSELRRALNAGIEQLRAEQSAQADALRAERDARIREREEAFQSEMRERVENLLEEQRVCFKQLSLEAVESAAAHERARRRIESRIEALEKK